MMLIKVVIPFLAVITAAMIERHYSKLTATMGADSSAHH